MASSIWTFQLIMYLRYKNYHQPCSYWGVSTKIFPKQGFLVFLQQLPHRIEETHSP